MRRPNFAMGTIGLTFVMGMAVGVLLQMAIQGAVRLPTDSALARFFQGKYLCLSGGSTRPFAEHNGAFDDVAGVSLVYKVQHYIIPPTKTAGGQELALFRSSFFGKVLTIDKEIMLTEQDEAHYHEMIPACRWRTEQSGC